MMSNKTWFITGASSGFGFSFTKYALSKGYEVIATARNVASLEGLSKTYSKQLLIEKMDVTKAAEVRNAVASAQKRFGKIDVLINNAGYGIVGAVEETSEAELRAQMETNFFGAVSVTKEVLPMMRKQKSGAVVNISSMGGQLSFGGFSAYSASKFALEGMSEALAQELMPFGIKVLIVEPGAFRTDFAASALKHMPIMEDYKEIVGPTRQFASGMNGTQAGDPMKAAQAIELALSADVTPLRLQLGADAIDSVRAHSEQLLADMKKWEAVSRDTLLENI